MLLQPSRNVALWWAVWYLVSKQGHRRLWSISSPTLPHVIIIFTIYWSIKMFYNVSFYFKVKKNISKHIMYCKLRAVYTVNSGARVGHHKGFNFHMGKCDNSNGRVSRFGVKGKTANTEWNLKALALMEFIQIDHDSEYCGNSKNARFCVNTNKMQFLYLKKTTPSNI